MSSNKGEAVFTRETIRHVVVTPISLTDVYVEISRDGSAHSVGYRFKRSKSEEISEWLCDLGVDHKAVKILREVLPVRSSFHLLLLPSQTWTIV